MNKKNKILIGVFVVCCIIIMVIAGTVFYVTKNDIANENIMCDGIVIDGVDVGKMTLEQAESAVKEHIDEIGNRKVTIDINGNKVNSSFYELGFSCLENNCVEEAFKLGKSGNIIQKIVSISKLSKEDKTFSLEYTVDKSVIEQFVKDNCSKFNVKVKNSKLVYENGEFNATRHRVGVFVNEQETVDNIYEAIAGNSESGDVEVQAVVTKKKPRYTKKMVAKCKDVLGTYTTSYGKSTADRANNVQTAAAYINGTVLYPGQTFSTIKVIKDRTEENGYKAAAEYSGGKVVSGIGGGVCQVSTTLYNTVLNAELEIVERSPHSMVVGYVDVSRDAAISGDYKDFKFKNNTDAPVYISASASGGYLSFKIYGHETRPSNRKIAFEPEILEKIQPGPDIVTEDAAFPASYRVVTQSAHIGYKAKLWKIIYEDGIEKERVEVNTSSYSAQPQYVTVGKQQPTPTPAPTKEPGESGEQQKPANTPAPEASRDPEETTATARPAASAQ